MAIKHKILVDEQDLKKGEYKAVYRTVGLTPIKAIRYKCLECCGFYKDLIRDCTEELCALHPFRMGKNPGRKGIGGKKGGKAD